MKTKWAYVYTFAHYIEFIDLHKLYLSPAVTVGGNISRFIELKISYDKCNKI